MAAFSNANAPFGSARFAGPKERAQAGMYRQHAYSVLVGFDGPKPLFYSQFQVPDRKFCIYWNPTALHGLRGSRINPVDYLRKDSRTLVSDCKVFCENKIASSGAAQSAFFEGRAREYLEAFTLTLVEINGVLTLPALYHAINLLVAGGDAWLDFAFEMSESSFAIARRIEAEIASNRDDTSGGYKGILGELTKAFSCLSDPALMDSVSPPFDFSLSQLCESDQTYNLYLMPPAEFAQAWAPVLKDLLVAGMIYKSRSPSAPRQTWVLDECAQLGAFPLVVKLFTYGAGIGIRPWAIFQSSKQMKALGVDAEDIIMSSAALQSWFGIRDPETANKLSRMLGKETLSYVDEHRQEAARHAQRKAAGTLLSARNPVQAAMDLVHHARMASLPVLKERALRSEDELLGMLADKQVIFADGLSHPIWADRVAYYEQPFMAGRYHPNPYHPPSHAVRVRTRHGYAWRPVITEPVPRQFAHYPQYADGTWSRIG